jgi:hypothetical protein
MKRLLALTACLLLLFATAVSLWANCKRSFPRSDTLSNPTTHAHHHEHQDHGSPGHPHQGNPLIHCAPVTDYLPAASFSLQKDSRVERLTHLPIVEFQSHRGQNAVDRWVHGPPGSRRTENIPPYLMISVLRI